MSTFQTPIVVCAARRGLLAVFVLISSPRFTREYQQLLQPFDNIHWYTVEWTPANYAIHQNENTKNAQQ